MESSASVKMEAKMDSPCPDCDGTGQFDLYDDIPCEHCHETGFLTPFRLKPQAKAASSDSASFGGSGEGTSRRPMPQK